MKTFAAVARASARPRDPCTVSWNATLLIAGQMLLMPLLAAPLVQDPAGYSEHVHPYIKEHCIRCHGPEKQKGKLRLDTLEVDFNNHTAAAKWLEVVDNINLGEMPPEDEPVPPGDQTAATAKWIMAELRHAQRNAQSTGGRVLMRRLSRSEYANTVRDLLNVAFLPKEGPLDLLPPDGSLDGFDKVSKALLLDPSLMEQYFDVAAIIADKAIVTGPPPVPTRNNHLEYEDISGGIAYIKTERSTIVTANGIVTMEHGMRSDELLKHPWNRELIPVRGVYRLRLRVGADPGDRGEPLYIRIERQGDGDLFYGKVNGTFDEPEIIEIVRPFDSAGGGEIGVRFENPTKFGDNNQPYHRLNREETAAREAGDTRAAGRVRARIGAEGILGQGRPAPNTLNTNGLPRLFFDWIELEGPLYDQWPPQSTVSLFHKGLDESTFDLAYAREIFARLLPRAFRRPVADADIDAITGIVQGELDAGTTFPEAVKAGIIATLCSPSFLLLNEASPDDAPRKLNEYELANRLSYFIWSSMPDAALAAKAAAGQLRPALSAEVDRMLADPKAEAMVQNFAHQWLKAGEFDRFAIDRNLYKDFYAMENAGINDAVNEEPLAFFREVMQRDLKLTYFLRSDWTMANEKLARYYGLDEVKGETFVRVSLPPGSHRGGLVTMAAVHKWGSDGNRTKPVERGKYMLDVLFNDPPPPPPPNAGEVEPNIQGENLTVRQRLDQHRQIESCATCHRGIDPYGFGLENFNVAGQWREKQDGERGWWPDEAVVNATGTLPNGVTFTNIDEFRDALAAQSDRFLRGFTEKMLTYALGRTIEYTDRETVNGLVTEMKAKGETIRSLVQGIVSSEEFETK
ncbi:MAG: mono/diheme cytochrome c family protein [Verrucomicrobiales bacterium]|jgi:mono/diheme cytochrome c family protein